MLTEAYNGSVGSFLLLFAVYEIINMSIIKKCSLLIFFVLLADQALKVWIKTNMYLGQNIPIFGDWFIIHFTENNGMAFGIEFGGEFGKMVLSIFRILAVFAIGWYILYLAKSKAPKGVIVSISLIFAGAIGNIIDSAFYGLLFSETNYKISEFLPEGGGYASFLHGKVVDMLYFPIIDTKFPEWFPFWGNESLVFFRPVFNIADSAITIGVFIILIFQRQYLQHELSKGEQSTQVDTPETELKQESA